MNEPDEPALPQGQRLGGDFEIVRELAKGGMGSVYLARQLSTDAIRALKVMRSRYQHDAAFVRRFSQEARASARIKSSHVIEVIAAGVDDALGTPWLAMEYLDGITLGDAMSRFGVPGSDDARVLIEQLFHAIAAAHDARIVHRDLKPENVLLARAEGPGLPFTLKVLDFGIAKFLAAKDARATDSLRTLLWGAPEQSSAGSRVGPQADVWALGLLVFWLLTGESYWHAERSLQAIFKEIAADPLPLASLRARELGCSRAQPAAFDDWFASCVARAPSQRFAHARDAARALFEIPLEWRARANPWRASVGLELCSTRAAGEATTPVAVTETGTRFSAGRQERFSSTQPFESMARVDEQAVAPHSREAGHVSRLLRQHPPRVLLAAVLVAGLGAAALRWLARGPAQAGFGSPMSAAAASVPWTSSLEPPPGMRLVPAGEFRAGPWKNDLGDARFTPARVNEVAFSLSQPFFIDAFEVDVRAYGECVRAGACERSTSSEPRLASLCNAAQPGREQQPINCVDRAQARSYCRWVGKRLPTEAEWERAARGGDGRLYPWGAQAPESCEMAVVSPLCDRSPLPTRASGSRDARALSPFGVADLAGNVSEWVEDDFSLDPAQTPSLVDPFHENGSGFGVLRGGSWDQGADRATTTARMRASVTRAEVSFGFRCALAAAPRGPASSAGRSASAGFDGGR